MKQGPSTPDIKRYFKACENQGYKPTGVKISTNGDVIMFFGADINLEKTSNDMWEIQIEKS